MDWLFFSCDAHKRRRLTRDGITIHFIIILQHRLYKNMLPSLPNLTRKICWDKDSLPGAQLKLISVKWGHFGRKVDPLCQTEKQEMDLILSFT